MSPEPESKSTIKKFLRRGLKPGLNAAMIVGISAIVVLGEGAGVSNAQSVDWKLFPGDREGRYYVGVVGGSREDYYKAFGASERKMAGLGCVITGESTVRLSETAPTIIKDERRYRVRRWFDAQCPDDSLVTDS